MTTFEDLGLGWELCGACKKAGWSEPTPVQVQAIPEGLKGRDIIARAQTGTGKTGAYSMILMSRIPSGKRIPSAIVVTPTRELAIQVEGEMRRLSLLTGHFSVPVYGGSDMRRQIITIQRGTDIVVGTPGRIRDMVSRGVLDLSSIQISVIDEADRMFDMGFEEDLDFILDALPEKRQMLMFSATMTSDVEALAERKLSDPVRIDVSADNAVTGLTKQYIIRCQRDRKRDILMEILGHGTPKAIVFAATKTMVDELYEDMRYRGMPAGTLHGDMKQSMREKVTGMFRDNRLTILLATDVAARGLDVSDVDIVINFDIPKNAETYLHRIGRTGRAGKEGIAVSLVTKREQSWVRDFEEATDSRIYSVRPEEVGPFDTAHPVKEEARRPDGRRGRHSGERDGRPYCGGIIVRCAGCGKECDVPFIPRGDRPVYCRDCYAEHRSEERPRYPGHREREPYRKTFTVTCARCGKETEIDFRPTEGRPVYCRDCYSEDRGRGGEHGGRSRGGYDRTPAPAYGRSGPRGRPDGSRHGYTGEDGDGPSGRYRRDGYGRATREVPGRRSGRGKGNTAGDQSAEGYSVIEIGLGKDDGFNRSQIADIIRKRAGLDDGAVGKVGLRGDRSFVEVSGDHCDRVIEQLDGFAVGGKAVKVTFAPRKTSYKRSKERR